MNPIVYRREVSPSCGSVNARAEMEVLMKINIQAAMTTILAIVMSDVGLTQEVERINILPTVFDGVIDQQGDASDFDGLPDTFTEPGFDPTIFLAPGFFDSRLVLEFDVTTFPNRHIRRAAIRLVPIGVALPSGHNIVPIEVRSYLADGVRNLGDFHRGTFVTVVNNALSVFDTPIAVEVTSSVRNAISQQKQYVGFVFRTNSETQLAVARPRLVVTLD